MEAESSAVEFSTDSVGASLAACMLAPPVSAAAGRQLPPGFSTSSPSRVAVPGQGSFSAPGRQTDTLALLIPTKAGILLRGGPSFLYSPGGAGFAAAAASVPPGVPKALVRPPPRSPRSAGAPARLAALGGPHRHALFGANPGPGNGTQTPAWGQGQRGRAPVPPAG